jgi:hypothetical protein
MMRIVENSHSCLRLSNADSFWSKWGFVAAIVTLLLGEIFIAVNVIHPVCWSGAVVGFVILFLIIRELPRSFDSEYWFDRANKQFKVIKHPWLGKQMIDEYSFDDITEVSLVENKHRNYPGHDYIEDENMPVEPPTYEVELAMRSGNKLMIYGAAHLAQLIADFLELPFAPPA